MTDDPKKLTLVQGARGEWASPGTEQDAHDALTEIMTGYDRVVIVGIRRAPNDPVGTEMRSFRSRRSGTLTSAMELVGAMYQLMHDWLGEQS